MWCVCGVLRGEDTTDSSEEPSGSTDEIETVDKDTRLYKGEKEFEKGRFG